MTKFIMKNKEYHIHIRHWIMFRENIKRLAEMILVLVVVGKNIKNVAVYNYALYRVPELKRTSPKANTTKPRYMA